MKKLITIFTFPLLCAASYAHDYNMEEMFSELYCLQGTIDVSEAEFVRMWTNDLWNAIDLHKQKRSDIADESMCDWFRRFVRASVPETVDFDGTNRWLRSKEKISDYFSADTAISNDTNSWFVVASEIGRIRARKKNEQEFDLLAGLNMCNSRVDENGVKFIAVPNIYSESWIKKQNEVKKLKAIQACEERVVWSLKRAIEDFARSSTFIRMDEHKRSQIVSNIVDFAQFTYDESVSLGLCNPQ